MRESQTYSRLFLVLFPDYKNISMYLPESLHDLNKSWLLSFVSRAVRATGLWRPLNYSSQTDDWLLIHSFFWKECLIIIPISTPSREKLPSQAVKILHSSFTGSSKLKGSASDTLRMAHQKLRRKKKDELCKISLNIAFCRGWCPTCPSFPVPDKRAIGMRSGCLNRAEVNSLLSFPIPRYHQERGGAGSGGFSKRKALGDKMRGDDHTVIEWDVYLESGLG